MILKTANLLLNIAQPFAYGYHGKVSKDQGKGVGRQIGEASLATGALGLGAGAYLATGKRTDKIIKGLAERVRDVHGGYNAPFGVQRDIREASTMARRFFRSKKGKAALIGGIGLASLTGGALASSVYGGIGRLFSDGPKK